MFCELNNLLPDVFNPRSDYKLTDHRIKYGLNANITFDIKDEQGNYKGNRPGAFIGNEVTLFGAYKSNITDDVPIYDGMRTDVLNTEGEFDLFLAEQVLMKTTADRATAQKMAMYLGYAGGKRNCVSLLYNLLRLYSLKEHKGVVYDPNATFYDNGHIQIKNHQMFPGYNRKMTIDNAVVFGGAYVTDANVMWREDCVPDTPSINWTGMLDGKSTMILSEAAGSWTCMAPFGAAHSSDALATTFGVNATGGRSDVEPNSYGAKDVLYVLNKVVTDNGLYTDFMFAYLMYIQVLVSPVPRSAEAAAWFQDVQVVTMPRFVSDTGVMPQLYQGKVYARYKNWKETYMNFKSFPRASLFHSIMLVEAAYVELNNLNRVRPGEGINRENFVEVSVQGQPITMGGILNDLTLLSMRYSKEFALPYPVSTGLTRTNMMSSAHEMKLSVTVKDLDAPKYYEIEDKVYNVGDEAVLTVTNFTAPLYPVMSYGINTDDYYANDTNLEISFTAPVNAKGITFKDAEPFSKFMNVMRMSGYDVAATEMFSQKRVINWADNASGRFLYTDAQVGEDVFYHIKYADIKRRNNCWINMLTFVGDTVFKADISAVNFKVFNGSKETLLTGRKVYSLTSNDYTDKALEIASKSDVIKIIPLKKVMLQDFRFLKYQFPGVSGAANTLLRQENIMQFGQDEQEPVNPVTEDVSIRDIE
ncbi:coat protein [Geotrichum candidum totivirus 3a]|nr:coat protein [Geotrichum candidum totivirus 3a]